ncbi:MAG: argininosuccinate lyase [Dehalococcoidia bacterium]|nr:argininosuccinate lyase [Dehalococcoidia bacterium]
MSDKRWGGRFEGRTDELVEAFTASTDVDAALWREDIDASIAHARMLGARSIVPADDAGRIVVGLQSIAGEIERGEFTWRADLEDVHGNIEARLAELIGAETAGRLHTARSRNDQVTTDLRLWLKRRLPELRAAVAGAQKVLIDLAERNEGVLIPGYTHLQRAQPVLLAHHLLAYFEMLDRDRSRIADCLQRADELPLGSGALAGVPYPIDRQMVADELGFARLTSNSIDAVSDRDYVIEVQSVAAICMMHLSRLAEEIVIWTSSEFRFAVLDDSFATGSSIMPQKKNPDVAELIRGRSGGVYGNLVAILATMKGLPLAYNRDLQEDKKGLFETVGTLASCLEATTGMLGALSFERATLDEAASDDALLATDYADYLVQRGAPFSKAHAAVGKLVRLAEQRGVSLSALDPADLRKASALFDDGVSTISVATSLASRDVPGGTAPRRVNEALGAARARLEAD